MLQRVRQLQQLAATLELLQQPKRRCSEKTATASEKESELTRQQRFGANSWSRWNAFFGGMHVHKERDRR